MTLSIRNSRYKRQSITTIYHYPVCHYAKCRVLLVVMLGDIMLTVVMLSVVAPIKVLGLTERIYGKVEH